MPTTNGHSNGTSSSLGRVAVITGSAQGIGKAIALRLAHDGFDIAICDLPSSQAKIDSVVREIEGLGRKAAGFTADVTQQDQVRNVMEKTSETLGSVDVVVANAGIACSKLLLDTSVEEWNRLMTVNAQGCFVTYTEAARVMIKQGRGGSIVGASSGAAYKPSPLLGAYGASKWAVRGLTQVAAVEWGQYNIRCNSYCPGIVDTSMWFGVSSSIAAREGVTREQVQKQSEKDYIALGRIGQPEDVANLVSFFAASASNHITGQSWLVDGGMAFS